MREINCKVYGSVGGMDVAIWGRSMGRARTT